MKTSFDISHRNFLINMYSRIDFQYTSRKISTHNMFSLQERNQKDAVVSVIMQVDTKEKFPLKCITVTKEQKFEIITKRNGFK